MAVLDILIYPDERLRRDCADVTDFADPAFQQFIDDLIETMEAGPGSCGLAAPQVDNPIRAAVVDMGLLRKPPPDHHGRMVMCNPEILEWDGMETAREGCMSLPDYTGNVMRAVTCTVQYQERDGSEHVVKFEGFEARAVQHEMDHLDGRLFIDRLVSRKSDLFQRKSYQKKKKGS
ncbi:peptide deformylase [Magnetofaba australis]|uniref:Peptide deformylase n=1 Tax=Magnetofaba australis IT-1 TaxID=1434232 RepID=A0A1Y2K2S2_9PROT|nr:peptide deformylase [Magnetofaba australis]OSM01484.1 putative peptide deformylase [Magnetofaba australis IT-1]